MNIPFVVETVLHDGLLKYKFKNSKICCGQAFL